jgi:hypothetical protein
VIQVKIERRVREIERKGRKDMKRLTERKIGSDRRRERQKRQKDKG